MDLLLSLGGVALTACIIGYIFKFIKDSLDEKKKRISAETKLEVQALEKANESLPISDLVDMANKRNSD